MTPAVLDPAISAMLWIVVKASVLVGVAALAQVVMYRRASAAMRHLVWTLAISGMLLLPVVSLVVPRWPVLPTPATERVAPVPVERSVEDLAAPARPAASSPGTTASPSTTRPALNLSRPMVAVIVYATGVLVMLVFVTLQRWRVRQIAREAIDLRDPAWTRLLRESAASMGVHRTVRLLRSRERSMPMAFGTRRPAIVIPSTADTWPEDRRRAVVLHELAHVARYDCLTQSLAFAACALYWFHPAAWWAARRLRVERELACDDRVLAAGARPRDYAGHLLEIAYSLGSRRTLALAVTMARPRQLERRMLAALDVARDRSVPALSARVRAAAIAAALLLPLASVTSTVVARQPDADRTPPAASPLPGPPGGSAGDPALESQESRLVESAGRIVRGAAAAMGMLLQEASPGTWEIRPTGTEGVVHLRMTELHSSSSSDVPIQQLDGLTAAQLKGTGERIQFRLRRDAGTFTFEGVFRNGVGAGTFSFTADPSFPAELARRGFARPTAAEQYQLARHDVGYAFIDELKTQGYTTPPTSELVRAGQHGVRVAYLHEMGALGYRLGALEALITLGDHGVTPEYVRGLAEQGFKGLPADDLRRARDHGVTPEYVRGMRDAGYASVSMDRLVAARDHGVTPAFVSGLGDAGYRELALDQVIRVRDHGVTPEYARDMRQLGHGVPIDELVRARDHGVDVEFARRLASLGYAGQPLDSLVRLRDHGVTPEYVQELKSLGYDRLSADDLLTLRDHGLTADRIRAANARAGTRLPVEMLRRLAAGG